MKQLHAIVAAVLLMFSSASSQVDGDVIISEIANSGGKKAMYTGGEYIELLVVKEGGVNLGGWYLTDLSSPGGTPKETEGYIRFSPKEGSVFASTIPQGTYILICLGRKDDFYGAARLKEDILLTDGNNQVILFAYESPAHFEEGEGTIAITNKDNVALASDWKKDAAVDVVTWGGSTTWTGCAVTELPLEALENGTIVQFAPRSSSFSDLTNNTDPGLWQTTSNFRKGTPGGKNSL